MTPHPTISARILQDSARLAEAYADLCPDCGKELRATATTSRCTGCGYREESDSNTRQDSILPL